MAELGITSERWGSGCGCGVTAARPWRLRPWRGTGEERRRGGEWGVGEVGATTRRRSTRRNGDQGDAERLGGAWRARARHAHLPACSGKGKQLAGTGQHSAGPASGLPGKWPGKTLSLSFCFNSVFLFCRFVLNLVLKPIQFILLLTIFLGAKRIKTMLHKNISELLDLYLFNSRYKSNSNSY